MTNRSAAGGRQNVAVPAKLRKRRCPSCGKLYVGRPRQEPVCLTCDIRERAARGEHPAAIAVRFDIPRFLVDAVMGVP